MPQAQSRVKIPIVTIADSILVGWDYSDLLDWLVLGAVNQRLRHDLLPTSDRLIATWSETVGSSEGTRDKAYDLSTSFAARRFTKFIVIHLPVMRSVYLLSQRRKDVRNVVGMNDCSDCGPVPRIVLAIRELHVRRSEW